MKVEILSHCVPHITSEVRKLIFVDSSFISLKKLRIKFFYYDWFAYLSGGDSYYLPIVKVGPIYPRCAKSCGIVGYVIG